jgi:hypothetical protein
MEFSESVLAAAGEYVNLVKNESLGDSVSQRRFSAFPLPQLTVNFRHQSPPAHFIPTSAFQRLDRGIDPCESIPETRGWPQRL